MASLLKSSRTFRRHDVFVDVMECTFGRHDIHFDVLTYVWMLHDSFFDVMTWFHYNYVLSISFDVMT